MAAGRADYDAWREGGTYKVALHTLVGAVQAAFGGAPAAAGALGAGSAEAARGLTEGLSPELQQWASVVIGGAAGAMAGGTAGSAALAGAQAGLTGEQFNRQLHPSEEAWLRARAKNFAQQQGISEEQALARLTQQALRQVDIFWRALLRDGDDASAKAFLATAQETFKNDLNDQQKLFTAEGQQLFRPEMFADSANPALYRAYAQSGVSRTLLAGLTKELRDLAADTGAQAMDAASALLQQPGLLVGALWDVATNLPASVRDGVLESGAAIGEGAAVALNDDITAKLNSLYGADVSTAQIAALATRLITAFLTATGVGKAADGAGDAVQSVLSRKLDDTARALEPPAGKAPDVVPDAAEAAARQTALVATSRPSLLIVNHRTPTHIAKQLADAADEVGLPVEFTLTRDALYVTARPGAPAAPSVNGKPPLPMPEGIGQEPVAMYLRNQSTENQRYAHISGWIEEARLAQRIHELPDQQVVRWGGKATIHGEDVISVNPRTGEVTLWDSKYRSKAGRLVDSPTFNDQRRDYEKMLEDVTRAIQTDPTLSISVKRSALENVRLQNFRQCTAGAGQALNSICK
jgi:hypothetical protein